VSDKRMLIINSEVAQRIDENRGDMSYSDFLDFLIQSQLKEGVDNRNTQYIQREEFDSFAQGMKDLLHNFMEFFLSYELELGKKPDNDVIGQISQKMKKLDKSTN
jgi:hypothetical protein